MNFVDESQANQTLIVELVAPYLVDAKPPVRGIEQLIVELPPAESA
jgi:hypothetical protein